MLAQMSEFQVRSADGSLCFYSSIKEVFKNLDKNIFKVSWVEDGKNRRFVRRQFNESWESHSERKIKALNPKYAKFRASADFGKYLENKEVLWVEQSVISNIPNIYCPNLSVVLKASEENKQYFCLEQLMVYDELSKYQESDPFSNLLQNIEFLAKAIQELDVIKAAYTEEEFREKFENL